MEPRTYIQRSDNVRSAIRPQLAGLPVLALLMGFLFMLPLRFFVFGEEHLWLVWVLGLALGVGSAYLLVRIRIRQLRAAAGVGRLILDEWGLTAEYGGTVRRLAWADIAMIGQVAYPASAMPPAALLIDKAVNAVNRAVAPKLSGVIGPGQWEGNAGSLQGRKLMLESQRELGRHPSGRPLVPIWFDDYEAPAGEILGLVRQKRPDLP